MATITATATADFEDVTQDFEAAARDMVTGEYLSDGQSFSLSSAMYATDSGDPQLDPAYGCTKVLIGGELLASDGEPLIALPDMRLAPHLVVGAMDRALRALAAWCDGKGSGLHTLYSCVYFQLPPEAITSAWLGPFVRGVVALHDYLIPYIKASSVVKSEDASALDCRQFNDRDLRLRALTPAEQRAQTLANASVEHANGAIRDLDAAIGALRPSEDREFYGTAEQTVEANVPADQRKTFASAIACRLSVVRHLLAVHTAIGECDMPRARKAARACLEEALPCVEGSLALGAEEPAGTFNAESWRRARGGIYVRRFAFPSAAEAVQTLRGMLEDVLEVCTVGGRDVTDYVALLHWAKHFTERPRSVLARVWASYLLRLTEKWLRRSAAVLTSGTFALIPVPKPIADHDSAVALEAAIAMAWEDTVDAFLLNRARLYRRLPAVFARWDGLQAEAAATDRALLALFPLDDDAAMAANPRKGMFFFMYVLHVKLFLMAEFLMCGLGLGLYCEHEYRYTLWYADYLLGIAENCLHDSIAQLEVFNRIHGGNGTSNNNSNGKKKTKRTKADKKNELMRELYSYYIGTYLLNIRGLVRITCALLRDGLLSEPRFPYGNREATYKYRFRDIQKVAVPAPVEYKVFNDSSNFHKFKADMLFQVATASFAKAREILQACNKVTTPENAPFFLLHDDITNWLREIATNLINAKLIPDAFNKDRDAYRKTYKVTFRYTASQFFPVVVAEKVTSKTEQK